jgi:cytochrome-b5 reductase
VKAFGMIAGGTGITPMLQITKAIMRDPKDKTQVDLLFANVNEEDILLKDDLDDLAKEYPGKFRVHYVLNNAPEGWTGGVGFVTEDMIKVCFPGSRKKRRVLTQL